MATEALKYTKLLMEEAVKKLNLGYHADWFLEELYGFDTRWSADISVKLNDRNNPGKRRPYKFKIVRIKHTRPDDSWIWAGGWRAHESVGLSQMENLAIEMSIKSWLMGLPYVGAKGGIAIDPHLYTQEELKDIFNKMTEKLVEWRMIGPLKDRLAPDVNTNSSTMRWIRDHYGYILRLRGEEEPFDGVATGKPTDAGGIHLRKPATGIGLHYALQLFRKHLRIPPQKMLTCAVNGFGNVGMHFAQYCDEFNIKVLAVGDFYGRVYKREGLPIRELIAYVEQHPLKSVVGFETVCKGEAIERADFFALPVYIQAPCAMEGDISEKEAEALRCKILLEGANSPTVWEADEIIKQKKIIVIPDIYANASGVVVSYFEWAHNVGRTDKYQQAPVPQGRDDDSIKTGIVGYMTDNGRELLQFAEKYQVSYRLAGYMVALSRVFPIFKTKRRMDE